MTKTYLTGLALLWASTTFSQGLTLFNDNYLHEIRFDTVDTMIFINTENYQSVNMTFDGFQVTSVGLKQKGEVVYLIF